MLRAGQAGFAAWLAVGAWCRPAWAQDSTAARPALPLAYGVEIALGSGHADRGFVINDRPVIQPVVWVSGSIAEFSVWGSLPLAQTTDSARPQVVELELTRAHGWRRLTVAPAVRMYFYRDPLNVDADRSLEGWLYLSYNLGPFSLYTNQSLDVLAYPGAYYGEAGITSEGRVSPGLEVGGSLGTGWASSAFNDAYADIKKSALDRVSMKGWLTAYVKPHYYISPHVEYSTMLDPAVRAALARPTFFFLRLTTGVEF